MAVRDEAREVVQERAAMTNSFPVQLRHVCLFINRLRSCWDRNAQTISPQKGYRSWGTTHVNVAVMLHNIKSRW
jgi:hypothetical protein